MEHTARPADRALPRGTGTRAVLYLHGKGGQAAECEHYRPLFPGCTVTGLDYRGDTPWEAGPGIRSAAEALAAVHGPFTLVANSIGAYFALAAGIGGLVRRAYFISPVVDLGRLIRDMMAAAGVDEAELEARGTIPTASGTLSWEYLQRVRPPLPDWTAPTHILRGSLDTLVPPGAIRDFARRHGAPVTVMDGGGHWFHTPEQMRFLDDWIRRGEALPQTTGGTEPWIS